MQKALTELERLDLAARAEASAADISTVRKVLLFFTLFVILLALISEATAAETMLVRVFAILSTLVTIILWVNWPYKGYALALLPLTFAIVDFLSRDKPHTIVVWTAMITRDCLFMFWSYALWKKAGPYALVSSEGWDSERLKVRQWLQAMKRHKTEVMARESVGGGFEVEIGSETPNRFLEFNAGSFWSGYFKYRILKAGAYWAVAKFRRSTERLIEYRVLQSEAVSFRVLPAGKLEIRIGNDVIREADASPDMIQTLEQVLRLHNN
jgi:hypothetical protein